MLLEKLMVSAPIIEKPDISYMLPSSTSLYFLRLDKIHPLYGGNKILKLMPFLKEFEESGYNSITTMGGAFSNHLIATAAVCIQLNIECHAIIRTYSPDEMNPFIMWLRKNNVHVHYTSPEKYRLLRNGKEAAESITGILNSLWIPEGGIRTEKFQFPENIPWPEMPFDIAIAAGTGTTANGLAHHFPKSTIYVFPAIRNWSFPGSLGEIPMNMQLVSEYHFGGFGKWNNELISFMHRFYNRYQIPLDVIYTGKMLFGIFDLIKNNPAYFKRPLLIVHTGGLTGNIGFNYRFPGVLDEALVNNSLLKM